VEGGSEIAWFTSAPPEGSDGPIRVVVFGDDETNNGDHALVARAAAAERPHLALHTGDMVANAKEEALWRFWFAEEHDLLAHAPIVPAPGDREITDQGAAYARFFQRRGMPAYASLDYGPLHVVVLDSWEIAAGATPQKGRFSEAQKAWLEEDLRRVAEDRHVFIVVHQGPFAHPREDATGHGASDEVRAAIAAANRVHPVEVVFAGHEHFYERGDINGIRYLVLGGGGAPLGEADPNGPGLQASANTLSFATVEVCGCHVRARVKDVAGKVIDAIALSECATPCSIPGALTELTIPAAASDSGDDGSSRSRKKSRRRRRGSLEGSRSAGEDRGR
jgi:3',5'-cyclic AMP phosphodiesterase CpdA